ncbi:MAG: ABC transporter ATP-binding protein [Acidimicrobiia bacterium]
MSDAPRLTNLAADGARLIGRFVRAHPVSFAIAVFGSFNFAAAIVVSALVVGRITDDVIVPVLDGGEPIDGRLRGAVIALALIALWKAIGIVIRRSGATWMQGRTQADLRTRLIEHLLGLELSWIRRQSTGDLLAVSDSDAGQSTYVLGPFPFASGAFMLLIGSIVIVFLIDPLLGVITGVGLITKVVVDITGAWRTFARFEGVQVRRGETSAVAHESIDGALTVKALGREDHEVERFAEVSLRLRDELIEIARRFTLYDAVQDALPPLTTVAVLVVGASRIDVGAMSAGDLATIAYLLSLIAFPLRLIGFVLWEVSGSLAAYRRVEQVLQVDDSVRYGALATAGAAGAAGLASDGSLTFGFDDDVVLSDIDIDIEPGETVAIVGPTGSGKSTLVTLFARLWDPTAGTIRLDGRDLRDFARSALAGEVAFVGQDVFLFDDTVRGNISFGVDASDHDVIEAAKLAAAHDFITELPDGYATRLGERGTSLSGGQRQRIALARALVRRPRLLILDDATSAVDPSIETGILVRLKESAIPSTVVLVAYRRSSIALADRVVYLEDGKVLGQGTHDELVASVPGYARLIRAYEEDAAEREAAR